MVFHNPALDLTLLSLPGSDAQPLEPIRFQRQGNGVSGTVELDQSQIGGVVLRSGQAGTVQRLAHGEPLKRYEQTGHFSQSWLAQSSYPARWREVVQRSAFTLELMTLCADWARLSPRLRRCPSRPEASGNWDYRCIGRNSSFSVYALLGLGFVDEAHAFAHFLGDRVAEGPATDRGHFASCTGWTGAPT